MNKPTILSILFCALLFTACGKTDTNLTSPDGRITLSVGEFDGRLYYTLSRDSIRILDNSLLGFEISEGDLKDGLRIAKVRHSSFNETWEQVWGEEVEVENRYNEMAFTAVEKEGLRRQFSIIFRLFDDGLGFRYEFPVQKGLQDFVITDELTQFAFAADHTAWSIPWDTEFYEGLYRTSPISAMDTVCTPLTMHTSEGLYLALHEAALTDYAAMNLYPEGNTSVLRSYLTPWSSGEKVFVSDTRVTPWRTMIIAENPAGLMLSRLMLNLNEPCRIEDTSWIRPAKYIGIWWGMHMKKHTWTEGPDHGATTENVIRYIDFAASNNFGGVLAEGWNTGWEDWSSFDFTTSYPDFDIDAVTKYAASKGVELIGHHETGGLALNYEERLEDAFALYQKHGVKAVKTGYVGNLLDGCEMHSGQYAVRHYSKVIKTAAKYGIMIDNHEPVMPTGLQRTWPNLMTQEGVRGQEWDAWSADGGNPPDHTTIIPFTRGLAGPIDFTPVMFNLDNPAMPGTRVNTTLAKQLALFVVLYSPFQMASDMIENYEGRPEFEFIRLCPAEWRKTVIPHAEIGDYLSVARKDKQSENWYVGVITDEHSREINLALDFLDEGESYKAKIFRDGDGADYLTDPYPVTIDEIYVSKNTVLPLRLARSGGAAIAILKQ